MKIEFLQALFGESHALDFDMIQANPGIFEEFLDALFEISSQGDEEPEAE